MGSFDGRYERARNRLSNRLAAQLPFLCFLLSSETATETTATGYPTDDFQPTTEDPFPCTYVPVKGKEIVVDGKTESFTGYKFTLPAIQNGEAMQVTRKMRLRLVATATDPERDFEIEFVGDQQSVVREVFCQLIED